MVKVKSEHYQTDEEFYCGTALMTVDLRLKYSPKKGSEAEGIKVRYDN